MTRIMRKLLQAIELTKCEFAKTKKRPLFLWVLIDGTTSLQQRGVKHRVSGVLSAFDKKLACTTISDGS